MNRKRYFPLLLALFGSTAMWAAAQPTEAELRAQQERFELYRKHPEHIKRLRENYQAFQSQPQTKREAVVKLDEDMHGLAERKKARYWGVLERYTDWLEQLKTKN